MCAKPDRLVGGRRHERRAQRDLANVAAGEIDLAGKLAKCCRVERVRFLGQATTPDLFARFDIRTREIDDEPQAAQERGVEVLPQIGRQDREALVRLHALQQVGDFDVRVAIVRVLHFTSLAEQCVRFVDEERGPRAAGIVEHAIDVLLGVADVLADDARQIDAQDLHAQAASPRRARPWSCRCRSAHAAAP